MVRHSETLVYKLDNRIKGALDNRLSGALCCSREGDADPLATSASPDVAVEESKRRRSILAGLETTATTASLAKPKQRQPSLSLSYPDTLK